MENPVPWSCAGGWTTSGASSTALPWSFKMCESDSRKRGEGRLGHLLTLSSDCYRSGVVPEYDVEQLWTERVFVAVPDGHTLRASGRCFEVKNCSDERRQEESAGPKGSRCVPGPQCGGSLAIPAYRRLRVPVGLP